MNTDIIEVNGKKIAVVNSDAVLIEDGQTALDFMMTVKYETECERILINKDAVAEDFFILSNGLAGEILPKFINYRVKLAIVGDYSKYTSKPLQDFIYESNNGKDFFFVLTVEEALEKLSCA